MFLLGADYIKYRVLAGENTEPVDKIADYWHGRYLSSGESAWRLMGFQITKKKPCHWCPPRSLTFLNHFSAVFQTRQPSKHTLSTQPLFSMTDRVIHIPQQFPAVVQ